jgi:hypothetical protein
MNHRRPGAGTTSADSKTWALASALGLGLVYKASDKHGPTDQGNVSAARTDKQRLITQYR